MSEQEQEAQTEQNQSQSGEGAAQQSKESSQESDQTPQNNEQNNEPLDVWGKDGLDDEMKAFIGEKTPSEVAKELHEAQKLIGKKTIGIPDKNSTPEEQQAYHAARGVPEDAAGYDLTNTLDALKENMPADWKPDADREAKYREWAKGANLSNSEANEMVKRILTDEMEGEKSIMQAATAADKKTEDLVVENWGADREEKENAANAFARQMGFDEDVTAAFLKSAGTNPEVRFKLINFFAENGALLEEGGDASGGSRSTSGMSKEQASVAKDQYLAQGDNLEAYNSSVHPRHKEVEMQVTKYLKIQRGL